MDTWLIMLAIYPAPNPLSMFTTLTPLAQELSMDKRADKPHEARDLQNKKQDESESFHT